jgi:hypothetical protein
MVVARGPRRVRCKKVERFIVLFLNNKTMPDAITFNQDHLNSWQQACVREGDLRRNGAPEVEIKAAKLDVLTSMITLMAPHMSTMDLGHTLLAFLVSNFPSNDTPVDDPDSAGYTTDASAVEDEVTD